MARRKYPKTGTVIGRQNRGWGGDDLIVAVTLSESEWYHIFSCDEGRENAADNRLSFEMWLADFLRRQTRQWCREAEESCWKSHAEVEGGNARE